MPHDPRRFVAPLVASALALALSSVVIGDAAAKIKPTVHRPLLSPRIPVIAWSSCSGVSNVPGLQCAFATVPLDYSNPDGSQITLALARVPARRPDLRIGSLFINPGGPGGSGVWLLQDGFVDQMDPAIRDRFDIVGFDPRGIGQSTPLECWANHAQRQAYFANSPVFPYRADQEQAYFNHRTNIYSLCVNRGQTILRHMSTADVARDLDLLRLAFGEARLNYLGYSYGSYLGETYANMFPMNIRTMVIDGVLDPVVYSSGNQLESNKSSFNPVQQQFFAQCEAAGAQCPLNGNGGPKVRFDKVLNALRTTALTYNDGQGNITTYTYDSFVQENTIVLQSPELWKTFATTVASLSNSLPAKHKPSNVAPRVAGKSTRMASAAWATINDGNFVEAFLGNHCADIQYPTTLQQYSQRGQDAAAASVQGPEWAWETTGCASWPVAQYRYRGPWTMMTSAPVLIVNSYYDGATEYANAVAVSRMMPNSRLLSYAGWGHTVTYTKRSPCADTHVSNYLIHGTLPAAGTVCPAAQNPFTVSTKAADQRNALLDQRWKPRPKRAVRPAAVNRPAAGSPPARRR